MTGPGDEPHREGDGESGLDEPRPPSPSTDPVQDPIDWDAQGEHDVELDGELNEPRPPSSATDTVQETPESLQEARGDATSDRDESESGAEGDGA